MPVACYINTTASVKAECDVCVTSSNYLKICERLPGDKVIFVPDRFMGNTSKNIYKVVKKLLFSMVNVRFTPSSLEKR